MGRWIEETLHADWRVRLKAGRVLHETRTAHQYLVIFENAAFGRVLMLDGVVQLTTSDEFVYHEMMAHVPLLSLERPRDVLIVGGGDGGVLREVLRHPGVRKVVLCEIDRGVIDLCLEHLPGISAGAFEDPRVDVVIADGARFVRETRSGFDAIICDTTEPIGPAASVFRRDFFEGCRDCLRPGGVLVTQNGLPFVHPEHLRNSVRNFRELFRDVACFTCSQPTYFGGPFALLWASDDPKSRKTSVAALRRRQRQAGIVARYYTPAVHQAAFALPRYIEKIVGEN